MKNLFFLIAVTVAFSGLCALADSKKEPKKPIFIVRTRLLYRPCNLALQIPSHHSIPKKAMKDGKVLYSMPWVPNEFYTQYLGDLSVSMADTKHFKKYEHDPRVIEFSKFVDRFIENEVKMRINEDGELTTDGKIDADYVKSILEEIRFEVIVSEDFVENGNPSTAMIEIRVRHPQYVQSEGREGHFPVKIVSGSWNGYLNGEETVFEVQKEEMEYHLRQEALLKEFWYPDFAGIAEEMAEHEEDEIDEDHESFDDSSIPYVLSDDFEYDPVLGFVTDRKEEAREEKLERNPNPIVPGIGEAKLENIRFGGVIQFKAHGDQISVLYPESTVVARVPIYFEEVDEASKDDSSSQNDQD
ncbi:MAG: hypothetical protein AB7F43_13765 [Bacteriovoracia bacterium]